MGVYEQFRVLQEISLEFAEKDITSWAWLGLFKQDLGHWAPNVITRHRAGAKGALQRAHVSSLGSALVLDLNDFNDLNCFWFVFRFSLTQMILDYESQASSTITWLIWMIISNAYCWNMPVCSNITDHATQMPLLTRILNEIMFVLACCVFCQYSSYLQWACFSNILLFAWCYPTDFNHLFIYTILQPTPYLLHNQLFLS